MLREAALSDWQLTTWLPTEVNIHPTFPPVSWLAPALLCQPGTGGRISEKIQSLPCRLDRGQRGNYQRRKDKVGLQRPRLGEDIAESESVGRLILWQTERRAGDNRRSPELRESYQTNSPARLCSVINLTLRLRNWSILSIYFSPVPGPHGSWMYYPLPGLITYINIEKHQIIIILIPRSLRWTRCVISKSIVYILSSKDPHISYKCINMYVKECLKCLTEDRHTRLKFWNDVNCWH